MTISELTTPALRGGMRRAVHGAGGVVAFDEEEFLADLDASGPDSDAS